MTTVDDLQIPKRAGNGGRKTTITAAFTNSILPRTEPTREQRLKAIATLGLDPQSIQCAYCGDIATEWDHLRPVVTGKKPTGWITEIANLVPSCGKCNQSKGSREWKVWMRSKAKNSPTSRAISGIEERINRLGQFEAEFSPSRVDFTAIENDPEWESYWRIREAIFAMLDKGDEIAQKLRKRLSAACQAS